MNNLSWTFCVKRLYLCHCMPRFQWTMYGQTESADNDKVAEKYHIKFGREKSQIMIIGNTRERPQFTLGQMQLDLTTTYKYLGEMINDKTNLKDHKAPVERKLEAVYQTILAIMSRWSPLKEHTDGNSMEAGHHMPDIPIITYGGETRKPTNTEKKKLNQLLASIIKRWSTHIDPYREALYILYRVARHRNLRWQKQYTREKGSRRLERIPRKDENKIWHHGKYQ